MLHKSKNKSSTSFANFLCQTSFYDKLNIQKADKQIVNLLKKISFFKENQKLKIITMFVVIMV